MVLPLTQWELDVDCNRLYLEQQVATMRANSASDCAERRDHQSSADALGRHIADHQIRLGAAAACGWTALRSTAACRS